MSAPQHSGNASDQHSARIGQVLDGRWELVRLLGAGASAEVYEAKHRNGNRVAVKILHEGLAEHPVACNRLYAEARIANRIAHPNLVRVHDEGVTSDGCPFLVMELLEGLSVEQRLREGRLPLATAIDIADQVLDALAAAHDAGVTHLDVKPGNIFCCQDGTVRLLDFGVSASKAEGVRPHEGIAVGTPAFMSPEQTRGNWSLVDGRSDLWSVGGTLFNMIAGRPVRLCNSAHDALRIAGSEPVISLRAVSDDAPDAVVEFVDRALQFDCKQRFACARDMQSALRKVLASLPDGTSETAATSEPADSPNSSVSRTDGSQLWSYRTVTVESTVVRQPRRQWTVPVLAAAAILVVCVVPTPASWLLDVAGAAYVVERPGPKPMSPAPAAMTVAMHEVPYKQLAPLLSGNTNGDFSNSNESCSTGAASASVASSGLAAAAKTKAASSRRRLHRAVARPSVEPGNRSEPVEHRLVQETSETEPDLAEQRAEPPFDPLAQRL